MGEHHEHPGAYARRIEAYSDALGAPHHQRAAHPDRQHQHRGLRLRRLWRGADARGAWTGPQSRHPLHGMRIVQCDGRMKGKRRPGPGAGPLDSEGHAIPRGRWNQSRAQREHPFNRRPDGRAQADRGNKRHPSCDGADREEAE